MLRLSITSAATRCHYPVASFICGCARLPLWMHSKKFLLASNIERCGCVVLCWPQPLDGASLASVQQRSQGIQTVGQSGPDLQPSCKKPGIGIATDTNWARTLKNLPFTHLMSSSKHCSGVSELNWRWKFLPLGFTRLTAESSQELIRGRTVERLLGQCRLYSQNSANEGESSRKPRRSTESAKLKEAMKEQLKRDTVLTVPNVLTAARMGLAPVIGYLVVHEAFSTAFGLFILAGISDLLDGWIARNFKNQTSAIGSFIDPLADKMLVSTLCVTLTMMSLIPMPLTMLIITRDLCLIVAAFYVRYISLPPPKTLARYFEITMITAKLQPTFISKLNTAVQLSLVAASLAAPIFSFADHQALHALWYLTAGTTIASGLTYIFAKDTFKIVQQAKQKP